MVEMVTGGTIMSAGIGGIPGTFLEYPSPEGVEDVVWERVLVN